MSEPLVAVDRLTVAYRGRPAVRDVSFTIAAGESYGLVGESGSGKSTIALALTRYLPPDAALRADRLTVAGAAVLGLDRAALRAYRADTLGVVYQEPGLALNPTMPVGEQVAEVLRLHGADRRAARAGVRRAFERVRLPQPGAIAGRFPHELSGGQQQRVVIATALAARPKLLILDEPTTGLDSKIETEIMTLIDELRRELGFATLLISHNLPLVAAHCHRLGVLRSGVLVEEGAAADVLGAPRQEYTRALVAAQPSLSAPAPPPPVAAAPLVVVEGLRKRYQRHLALDEVSLSIRRGEVLGIVGESGSGKSTLGRCLAGITGFEGAVRIDVPEALGRRPPVQMVFQNPDASLNPRHSVRKVLARSIRLLHGELSVAELAASVGLAPELLDALPAQLSGGQKQRVAIARAFAGRVPLVVCDEPTSALDVSIQARIIELLRGLQQRTGVSYLFISHDLAVVRQLAHRIGVLYEGRLVELKDAEELFARPEHPYTRELVAAARALRQAA
ncbi:MAG: ABC transporter ATP-binding protein [Microbacterium sp.]|uniref:ATP-binding cassette domain-containing protein n=1 Tax=Microbacterium sp. TaxID=51671 RepID=UPI0039E64EF4